ncbi:HMG (high mobility group) box protein [Rhizoctonia solani]|uniref:HMG (High mobility group) box protein n=1 Tax=Rhizoctonia solani TaxID=456999 RepID=A0A8H8NTZ1_9AGAM|nr:HMG (high mobility group) box protein [Rhizoctonia solani]QRW19981.1 HMG (high mobility group) box protein [Rhizoctonia solani]
MHHQLLEDNLVNDTGNLKRACNSFFAFRRARSVEILDHMWAKYGRTMNQADISAQLQREWNAFSRKRGILSKYMYTPIPNAFWNTLAEDGKKRFFFESIARIAKAMVDPEHKVSSYQNIREWARRPENRKYVKEETVETSETQATTTADYSSRCSFNQINIVPLDDPQDDSWLDRFKNTLTYIGPRMPGEPERMLEMVIPNPEGSTFPVYIEVDIPLGTPQNEINMIKAIDQIIPGDAIILRNYTKPEYPIGISDVLEFNALHSSDLPMHHDQLSAFSPLSYSSSSSHSNTTNNLSPITLPSPSCWLVTMSSMRLVGPRFRHSLEPMTNMLLSYSSPRPMLIKLGLDTSLPSIIPLASNFASVQATVDCEDNLGLIQADIECIAHHANTPATFQDHTGHEFSALEPQYSVLGGFGQNQLEGSFSLSEGPFYHDNFFDAELESMLPQFENEADLDSIHRLLGESARLLELEAQWWF